MTEPMTPGLPWEDIATEAYRAYAASTGNKNFKGDPMPAFADLPLPIKTAWEAAVRHTEMLVAYHYRPGDPLPCPSRWQGWMRPQDAAQSSAVTGGQTDAS